MSLHSCPDAILPLLCMHSHVSPSFGLAQCVLSRSSERFGDSLRAEGYRGGGRGGGREKEGLGGIGEERGVLEEEDSSQSAEGACSITLSLACMHIAILHATHLCNTRGSLLQLSSCKSIDELPAAGSRLDSMPMTLTGSSLRSGLFSPSYPIVSKRA